MTELHVKALFEMVLNSKNTLWDKDMFICSSQNSVKATAMAVDYGT